MSVPKTLRIFISSPGDVAEERERARDVVESLRRRYAGCFYLQPVLWEELPLQADITFQEGIDCLLSRDGVDVAVFILWSRLGSPLSSTIAKPDGTQYRSGTERELDLMMQARRQSGNQKPALLVYTRQDETSFEERLRGKTTKEKEELIAQKRLLEQFVVEEFYDSDAGHNRRAYHTFDRPVSFSQTLRKHLVGLLDSLAGQGVAEAIWDIARQGAPFQGLSAFQPEHADVFFGRETETLEARRALREQARQGCAYLLLSGASGSGKSSLARAGLLPTILENEVDEQVAAWRWVILTPAELGPDLLLGFAVRLMEETVLPELRSEQLTPQEVAEDLRRDPVHTAQRCIRAALHRAGQRQKGAVRVLILVDQLEELFTIPSILPEAKEEFLRMLEALARTGSFWVIATVRSDFMGHVQGEPTLVRMAEGGGSLAVLPPSTDALRRLIEEPARLAGLAFEEGNGRTLADQILQDAAAHRELLPLVEYVLRELYELRTNERLLTWAAYEQLGGVEGALSKRAEVVYQDLPAHAQAELSALLKALVTIGEGRETGSAEEMLRQRASFATLTRSPGGLVLTEKLIEERLLTTSRDPVSGEATVTVAHESLLRVWPRARQWAEDNRDFLRSRARLRTALKTWQDEGAPDDLLLPEGKPLEDARAIAQNHAVDLTAAELEYVRLSASHHQQRRDRELELERARRAEADRRRRIARRLAWAAVASAVVALLFGYSAWRLKAEADHARRLAEERERTANALLLLQHASQAAQQGDGERALALARAACTTKSTYESRNALLGQLAATSPYLLHCMAAGGDGVRSLAWSQDSRQVAVGLRSGALRLWPSEELLPAGPAREGDPDQRREVMDVAFPGAGSLAALLDSGYLLTHSLPGPQTPQATLLERTFLVRGALSADARRAAFTHREPHVVELAGGAAGLERRPVGLTPPGEVTSFRFSPDGQRLAIGTAAGGLCVEKDGAVQPWRPPDDHAVLALTWHPKGDQVALGLRGQGLELWQGGPEPVRSASQPTEGANLMSLDWRPQGAEIAGALGAELKRWAVENPSDAATTMTPLPFSAPHASTIAAVRWSPDGTRLASGDDDGIVKIWSTIPGNIVHYLEGGQPLHALGPSPDGKWIATGTEGGDVLIWEVATAALVRTIKHGGSAINALVWHPGSRSFACGDNDGLLGLYELTGERIQSSPAEQRGLIWQMVWVPGEEELLFSSGSGVVGRWKPRESGTTVLHTFPGAAQGLAISRDGQKVAMSSAHGTVAVKVLRTGQELSTYQPHDTSIGSLAWSPDGQQLAAASNDGTVSLSDPATPKAVRTLRRPGASGDAAYFEAVAFSPDGSQLAAAGQDQTIHVWQVATGEPLWQLPLGGEGQSVWNLCWPVAERLLSSSADGRVCVVDPRESNWLARAGELTRHVSGATAAALTGPVSAPSQASPP